MPLYISIRIEFYNGIVRFICHSTHFLSVFVCKYQKESVMIAQLTQTSNHVITLNYCRHHYSPPAQPYNGNNKQNAQTAVRTRTCIILPLIGIHGVGIQTGAANASHLQCCACCYYNSFFLQIRPQQAYIIYRKHAQTKQCELQRSCLYIPAASEC